jgi:hypothetical protein
LAVIAAATVDCMEARESMVQIAIVRAAWVCLRMM